MEVIIGIFMFIFGAVFASFAGVVIYRVPNKMSIVKPNSFCPSCHKEIKWYDNIPIISYLVLRGRCRYCHAKIGIDSLILELAGGLAFLLAYLAFGFSYSLIFVLPLIFLFIIMAGIDYHTHYIYDLSQVIYFVLALGFILFKIFYLDYNYLDYLIGTLVGFGSFMLIGVIGKLILKQECLGMGDIILMGISGLLLGWQGLILAILFGSLLGSIIELTLIGFKKKSREEEIAFGPYLLLGTTIALLYGEAIINGIIGMVM